VTNARRVQQIRARARVRNWEFRQRHLARGAWARFRFALAMARDAYAINDTTLRSLIADGAIVDDRGSGLEPPRQIVWIDDNRARKLVGATRLELRLDAALLGSPALALVPFAGIDPHAVRAP
jgi:hypothetical protein